MPEGSPTAKVAINPITALIEVTTSALLVFPIGVAIISATN